MNGNNSWNYETKKDSFLILEKAFKMRIKWLEELSRYSFVSDEKSNEMKIQWNINKI